MTELRENCYYDAYLKELQGNMLSKARHTVKLGRIKRVSEGNFLCVPEEGYNKTTYSIHYDYFNDAWSCNCQHNHVVGKICSHIIAVNLFIKLERANESYAVNTSESIISGQGPTGLSEKSS